MISKRPLVLLFALAAMPVGARSRLAGGYEPIIRTGDPSYSSTTMMLMAGQGNSSRAGGPGVIVKVSVEKFGNGPFPTNPRLVAKVYHMVEKQDGTFELKWEDIPGVPPHSHANPSRYFEQTVIGEGEYTFLIPTKAVMDSRLHQAAIVFTILNDESDEASYRRAVRTLTLGARP